MCSPACPPSEEELCTGRCKKKSLNASVVRKSQEELYYRVWYVTAVVWEGGRSGSEEVENGSGQVEC